MKAISVSLPAPDKRPGGGGYCVSHEKLSGTAFVITCPEEQGQLGDIEQVGEVLDQTERYVTLQEPIVDPKLLPAAALAAYASLRTAA